jgi:hypothetical protein
MSDEIKNRLAEERTAREKSQAEHREASAKIKPTPTQEENDLAASGVHVSEHEPDGSPVEGVPPAGAKETKETKETKPASGAQPRSDYQTRAASRSHE